MRRLFLAVLIFSPLLAVLFAGQGLAAIEAVGPAPSIRFAVLHLHAGSKPTDFKKQELPKKIPATAKSKTIPNLEPLIDQLVRHADLDSSAKKIMPWVYTTTTETVVADYEEAVKRLEFADECLQEAMRNVLWENNSLEIDPMLVQGTLELDYAEFTILLLVEIAKLEL